MTIPHTWPTQGAPDDTRANRALSRENLNTLPTAIGEIQNSVGLAKNRTVTGTVDGADVSNGYIDLDTSTNKVHADATTSDITVKLPPFVWPESLVAIAADRTYIRVSASADWTIAEADAFEATYRAED